MNVEMAPVKGRLPMRNNAGKFTKAFITSAAGPSKMKRHLTPAKRKYKRRAVRTALETPRIGKKTSVVWHFFKSLTHEDGHSRAMCLLCKVMFKNPGGSTTGMRGHLDRKHPGVVERVLDRQQVKQEPGSMIIKDEMRESLSPHPPSLSDNGAVGEIGETEIFESISDGEEESHPQASTSRQVSQNRDLLSEGYPAIPEDITKPVVRFLAAKLLPLYTVGDMDFRRMIFNPNSLCYVDLTDESTQAVFITSVETSLDDMCQEIKFEICEELDDKNMCISIELWVKSVAEIYMLASANFVNNEWSMDSRFLGARLLAEITLPLEHETLLGKVSDALKILLEEYGIDHKNISSAVFNGSPFDLDMSATILGLPQIPCFNQVLLRSYDILTDCANSVLTDDIMEIAKKVAKELLPGYKEIKMHPGKLMGSMKTFLMKNPKSGTSLDRRPEDVCVLANLQTPLNEIVEGLQDMTSIPLSTVLPLIFGIRALFDDEVKAGVLDSKWSFEQRRHMGNTVMDFIKSSYKADIDSDDLGDTTLAVASFLDPRYKGLKFLSSQQRAIIHDRVMELLQLLNETLPQTSHTGSIISVKSTNPDYVNLNGDTSDPLSINPTPSTPEHDGNKLASILTRIMKRTDITPPPTKVQVEFQSYIHEPEALIKMDPYLWWNYNEERYPTLSCLAKKFFAVPGVVAPTRMIFTNARKWIFNNFARIEQEFFEKLLSVRCYHTLKAEDHQSSDWFQSVFPQQVIEDEITFKIEVDITSPELMDEEA